MPRIIITVPEQTPQPYRFELDRMSVAFGRGTDNDIVIGSGSVSGRHAEMHRVPGGYELVDLDSTNGIKVDGVRRQKVILQSGMALKLGDVDFAFSLTEEELSVLASEEKPATLPPLTTYEQNVEPEVGLPKLPPMQDNADAVDPWGEVEPSEMALPEEAPSSRQAIKLSVGFVATALVLAAVAFFYGANMRHKKETEDGLLKGIVNKEDFKKANPDLAE